jgi:hypothetical protein
VDHDFPAFVWTAASILLAFALAYGFAGGVLNGRARSIRLAYFLGRSAAVLVCVYPILWAWGSPLPLMWVVAAAIMWGAVFGAVFCGIGWWYRFELEQLASESSGDASPTP